MLYCFHGSLRNLSDIQNNLRGSLVILLCADDNHFSCLICWNRLLPRVCKHQCSSLWLGLYEHFYITETNQWEPGSRIHTVPRAFLTVSSDPFLQLLLRAGFAHGPLCASALQCTVHGYLTLSGISTAVFESSFRDHFVSWELSFPFLLFHKLHFFFDKDSRDWAAISLERSVLGLMEP